MEAVRIFKARKMIGNVEVDKYKILRKKKRKDLQKRNMIDARYETNIY